MLWKCGAIGVLLSAILSLTLAACAVAPPPASPAPASPIDSAPAAPGTPTLRIGGRAEEGAAIFRGEPLPSDFVACTTCHAIDPAAAPGVGPNLSGVALSAGERVAGQDAPSYLERSIRFHDEFVADGYTPGVARAVVGRDFDELLTDEQVIALVAYLMTLSSPSTTLVPAGGAATAPAERPTTTPTPSLTPLPRATPSPRTVASATAASSPTSLTAATASASSSAPASETPVSPSPQSPTAAPVTATATLPASPTTTPTEILDTAPTEAPSAAPTPESVPPPSATQVSLPEEAQVATQAPFPEEAQVATLPSLPSDPDLARYVGCVSCHDQHPLQVQMSHPLNPSCNECHRGSPNRIGCPTCHSTHGIDNKHEPLPDLACATCHT